MDLERFLEKDMVEFIENKDIERKRASEAVMEEELEEEFSETKTGTQEMKNEFIAQSAKENIVNANKEEIKKNVAELSEKISVEVQKKDLSKAMSSYKDMKKEFSKYPEKDEKEKEKLFNDMIEAYYQIKKLKKDHEKEKLASEKLEEKEEKESHALADSSEHFELILKRTKIYLNHDDMDKAKKEYEHLKKVFEKFPQEYKEKKQLQAEMNAINNSINKKTTVLKKVEVAKEKIEEMPNKVPEFKPPAIESPENKKIKEAVVNLSNKILYEIQKEDLSKAMVLYKDMKKEFSKYPEENKQEKEKLFNDLIDSFYSIKKLEKHQYEEKTHTENLEEERKEHILADSNEKIQLSIKKIKVYLDHDDVVKAMQEYEVFKKTFEEFPKEFKEERNKLYNQMVVVYNEIHKKSSVLKQEILDKNEGKEIPVPKPLNKEKNEKINRMDFLIEQKKNIKNIIGLMKESKFEEAGLKLLDAKHAVNRFPEEESNEKEQFIHILDEISHRLNFLKQTAEIKN